MVLSVGLVLGVGAGMIIYQETQRVQGRGMRRGTRVRSQPRRFPSVSQPEPGDTVSFAVRSQVYNAMQGDQKGLDRLLNHCRATNPGRSEQWVWEKVLWQLERDRGRW